MIASTPDTEAGLRQGAVYGIGVSASAGGAHFAPYINDAVQVLINCISHPSAFQDGNGKRRRKQFNPINFGSPFFFVENNHNLFDPFLFYLALGVLF